MSIGASVPRCQSIVMACSLNVVVMDLVEEEGWKCVSLWPKVAFESVGLAIHPI